LDLVIGLDIGQRVDPTAIAVAEITGDIPPAFVIRFLERLTLSTPYPDVAARVVEVARNAVQRAVRPAVGIYSDGGRVGAEPGVRPSLTLVTDITGVGRPVHEIIARAITEARLEAAGAASVRLEPATFTHGDRLNRADDGGHSVGKAHLVSRLQALLQTGRIRLPRTRESEALAKELLDYEIHITEDANDRYGAFKVGTHDDLVTALGLAVLLDRSAHGTSGWWCPNGTWMCSNGHGACARQPTAAGRW